MTAELMIQVGGLAYARHASWDAIVNNGYLLIPFPRRNSASVIPDKIAGTPPRARMPQVFKNTIQYHYLIPAFNIKCQQHHAVSGFTFLRDEFICGAQKQVSMLHD